MTKEDKKDGTPGIRTIFEGIKSSEVFTVVFQKQDKAKTKKQYEAEREAQRQEAVALIDKAKKAKKSMAVAYIKKLWNTFRIILFKDFIEGEDRVTERLQGCSLYQGMVSINVLIWILKEIPKRMESD